MGHKSAVRTERAPAPFRGAPYSQAIRLGDLVFVSGQLPLDPATGRMVGGTIQEQTQQVFANLRAILEEAGSGLDRLVKTTVFLTTLADFAGMNEVYRQHVGEVPPARSTVPVGGAFPRWRAHRDRSHRARVTVPGRLPQKAPL
jgi:2-iminobutanoate/2-iminopropanoate deaminase